MDKIRYKMHLLHRNVVKLNKCGMTELWLKSKWSAAVCPGSLHHRRSLSSAQSVELQWPLLAENGTELQGSSNKEGTLELVALQKLCVFNTKPHLQEKVTIINAIIFHFIQRELFILFNIKTLNLSLSFLFKLWCSIFTLQIHLLSASDPLFVSLEALAPLAGCAGSAPSLIHSQRALWLYRLAQGHGAELREKGKAGSVALQADRAIYY